MIGRDRQRLVAIDQVLHNSHQRRLILRQNCNEPLQLEITVVAPIVVCENRRTSHVALPL